MSSIAKEYHLSRRQVSKMVSAVALTGLGLPIFARAEALVSQNNIAGTELPLGSSSEAKLVNTENQLRSAISRARPGETILLADGEWHNTEINFIAEGTPQNPIVLAAQTPGAVILMGSSRLTLSGAYLIASGLVFRNGTTPDEVIKFGSRAGITHHCRATNCAIHDYSTSGADKSNWVSLSGRFNRFDHNYVAGKSNQGVSVAVVLSGEGSDNNFHSIDHNYFGPRPKLGGNGGETIRVGTGKYLHHVSATTIEDNFFEECDGEAEIISLKTAQNIVRRNTFLRCAGAVTIRQGRENIVEDNIFLGEGAADTGGVRITGPGQVVRNNLFVGLRGDGNRSALTLMNGAPGESRGTYAPVVRAVIENNSFFDVSKLTFGARADDALSQAPRQTIFRNNLLVGTTPNTFEIESAMDGISMTNNAFSGDEVEGMAEGFSPLDHVVELPTTGTSFSSPNAPSGIGFQPNNGVTIREEVGVSYDILRRQETQLAQP